MKFREVWVSCLLDCVVLGWLGGGFGWFGGGFGVVLEVSGGHL